MNTIGAGAFQNCTALTGIYLPDSITFIGNNAFENCINATVLSLPANGGLAIIQDATFRNCTSLTTLTIPNGVQEIHQYAFEGCSNIEWVYTIPATVNFIGNYAFSGLRSDCWFVVENPNVSISKESFGTSGNIFGWINSSAQNYANAYAAINFYNIQTVRYVERCYLRILNRVGEASGVMHWAKRMALSQETGVSIVHSFVFSTEFANRGLSDSQVVEILYEAMLNRASDAAGKAFWMGFLDAGCSYDYVIHGFSEAPEFIDMCKNVYNIVPGTIALTQDRDQNVLVTAFVSRMYNLILNRKAEPAGLNTWTGHLNNRRMSGSQVVAGFISSLEFKNRGLSDSDQVEIIYETMLERASEPAGKAFWLAYLADGMSAEAVVKGFSEAIEFRYLCSRYGINAAPCTPSEYRDWNRQVTLFVIRLYQNALKHGADTLGLNTWAGAMVTKASTPAKVAKDILTSLEAQMKLTSSADFVDALYLSCLNRAPTIAEKSAGVTKLNAGTSREALVDQITGTAEFQNIVKGFGL